MKEIRVVSWKLPHLKCLANIFAKFSPSENNHVYSSKLNDLFKVNLSHTREYPCGFSRRHCFSMVIYIRNLKSRQHFRSYFNIIKTKDHHIIMKDHHIIMTDHIMIKDHHIIMKDHIIIKDHIIVKDHHIITKDHHIIMKDHIITKDHNIITKDHHIITKDHHIITKDHYIITKDHHIIMKDHKAVTACHTIRRTGSRCGHTTTPVPIRTR